MSFIRFFIFSWFAQRRLNVHILIKDYVVKYIMMMPIVKNYERRVAALDDSIEDIRKCQLNQSNFLFAK